MDKNYYYRVLGLRPDATKADIKKAYNSRMERLSSPDYADDSEYVTKKVMQARMAYNVLMGSAAPPTESQRKASYECYKDDIEAGRDSDHLKHRNKKSDVSDTVSGIKRKMKDAFTDLTAGSEIEIPKGLGKAIVAILIFIIPIVTSFIGDVVDDDYNYNSDAIDRIMDRNMEYDFWGYLLYPDEDIDAEDIEWEPSDDTIDHLWNLNSDLAYSMGIDSVEDIIVYLTGDEDEYWNNDDYAISHYITGLMNAPAFSDIAGMENIYTGEVIYTYEDYMNFLIMTAETQTDEICSIPAADYQD